MIVYTLLILLVSIAILSRALPQLVRLAGLSIGRQLKSRTEQRRALFVARADEDEKKSRYHRPETTTSTAPSEDNDDDDGDWEQINRPEAIETPRQSHDFTGVIGFFHPFCNAGGGGERVLFAAIAATQQRYPRALCAVYTGDQDASKEKILSNVHDRFNITLHAPRVIFIYLTTRQYVLATTWPHFTLLGQSVGSLLMVWEAFTLLTPDIYIDTMGYAFTVALAKWLFPSMPTGAYVHYPTISTDMLSSLDDKSGTQGLNSGDGGGGIRGKAKQLYWNLFAKLYSWAGGHVDVVMTNSSWTQNHIASLWTASRQRQGRAAAIQVVYPPCAVQELEEGIDVDTVSEQSRTHDLIYIAQFRPEKMHHIIIEAFEKFLRDREDLANLEPPPRLVLLGSVRDDADEKRVYKLRLQAQAVRDRIEFVVNAKWPQILALLRTSSVGVNGMWNEHFGIGVVEYQAAGLIAVVNASGGPKEDIVVEVDGEVTGMSLSSRRLCTQTPTDTDQDTTPRQLTSSAKLSPPRSRCRPKRS